MSASLVAKPHYRARGNGRAALVEYRVNGRQIAKASQTGLSPPDDSRGWVTIHDFFPGAFQRDVPINLESVLSNYAVFACRAIIASDIGKLGVTLTEWNDKQKIAVPVYSPSVTPFLTQPNEYQQSWQQFIEYWIHSKTGDGNTYVLKERDDRNVVVAGHILHPRRVMPLISQSGLVFYALGEDRLAQVNDADVVVPASEIIHDRYNCFFHPLVGISPIYASGLSAQHGQSILKQSAKFFDNSSVPSGILVAPQRIDDKLAKEYQTRWETNYTGAMRGRVAVLGNGLQYTPITQTAVEAEVVAQQQQSALAVCTTFGVPAWRIGIGEKPTYQNADSDTDVYYSTCLQPLVQAIESLLTFGLSLPQKGYAVALDEADLMRMNPAKKIDFVAKAVEKAIYSPNEGRREFNKPPAKGGDSPMLQQQMYSLAALAKRDALPNPFVIDKPTSNPTPSGDGPAPTADPAEPPPKKSIDDEAITTIAALLRSAHPELRAANE